MPSHLRQDVVFALRLLWKNRTFSGITLATMALAIGSTTGGLWVSEDRGASWQGIAERLPPVHAVTFA